MSDDIVTRCQPNEAVVAASVRDCGRFAWIGHTIVIQVKEYSLTGQPRLAAILLTIRVVIVEDRAADGANLGHGKGKRLDGVGRDAVGSGNRKVECSI